MYSSAVLNVSMARHRSGPLLSGKSLYLMFPIMLLLVVLAFEGQSLALMDAQQYTLMLASPADVKLVDVALGAGQGIALEADASVKRTDEKPAVLASLGQPGVQLNPRAIAGHVYSTSSVVLLPYSKLIGGINAASASIDPTAVVNGTVNTPATLTPLQEITFTVEFPEGNEKDVLVSPKKTRELLPARYPSVTVSPSAKLILQSGRYYIDVLILKPGSIVEFRQQTGPTYIFAKQAVQISASQLFTPAYRGLVVVQTEAPTINVGAPFHGALVAPNAEVQLLATPTPHRGAFYARSIKLVASARVIYEATNPLAGVIFPPEKNLQQCAFSIRPREDLNEQERELAFQADIARYCSMVGADECDIELVSRANVDYFYAVARYWKDIFSPAEYLAVIYDRKRKLAQAKSDPKWCQWIVMPDLDKDWIPDFFDQCPGTPELTATDDSGCPVGTLPPAPSREDVKKLLSSLVMLWNPRCDGAPGMPPPAPGLVHHQYGSIISRYGVSIVVSRITNQPDGCPVWYLFDIEELKNDGNDQLYVDDRYSVAFMDREADPYFTDELPPFEAKLVPPNLIQFTAYPTEGGTRGRLGSFHDRIAGAYMLYKLPVVYVTRYRVQAINGSGARSPWSDWYNACNVAEYAKQLGWFSPILITTERDILCRNFGCCGGE